jgi:beta-lactamase class A
MRRFIVGLFVLLGLAGSVVPAAAATTADDQLGWLVEASAQQPIPAAELTAHFAPSVLTATGGAAGLANELAQFGRLTVRRTVSDTPVEVRAIVGTAIGPAELSLHVDGSGLIDDLLASPYAPTPTSWAQVDSQLRALAPQVSFASSVLSPNGDCRVVHGIAPATQRPLGSAFKLYVLGALGTAVEQHTASWNEQLAINDAWKSLPSGILQTYPAGTKLTLTQYADEMISISDNTATDHLIHFLGRDAVQAQLYRFGNSRPRSDIPFPTTREMFALKGFQYPKLADAYLASPRPLRTAELTAADQVPLSDIAIWQQPERIDQLEWFGSPDDICRAYAGLWRENARPGMSEIGAALSINNGGIGFDPAAYPTVWYKGGSEPGVLTLNYLVRSASGQITVTSVMVSDPKAGINEWTATGVAMAAIRAAVTLDQ